MGLTNVIVQEGSLHTETARILCEEGEAQTGTPDPSQLREAQKVLDFYFGWSPDLIGSSMLLDVQPLEL